MNNDNQFKGHFLAIWTALLEYGECHNPRGLHTKELAAFSYTFPAFCRFANFKHRKLNLDYIKKEWQWYCNGMLDDLSICDHAAIWKQCVTDNLLFSNYGYYWFKRPVNIARIVQQLKTDPDSRQAVLTIHNTDTHSFKENKDVPCTLACTFLIRNSQLRLHIHMRSQDAVYGLCNDLPAFSFLQETVARLLSLEPGPLHLFVDSFHVYERHFNMLENILTEPEYTHYECPVITQDDAVSGFQIDTPFKRWLHA